jgi:hypothetical protein
MESSMAAAQHVVGQLPQTLIPDVRAAVNTAFLDGLQVGSLVSAGIALGAAIIVAWLLPARARQTAAEQDFSALERPNEVARILRRSN